MSESTTIIPRSYLADGITCSIQNNVISTGILGQIIQVAISISGSVTKASLNSKGWAICDGTDTATQVTTPTITGNTPDLRSKFLRGSANETTGGTGGSLTHCHRWLYDPAGGSTNEGVTFQSDGTTEQSARQEIADTGSGTFDVKIMTGIDYYTQNTSNQPPYYDICYFMKVK